MLLIHGLEVFCPSGEGLAQSCPEAPYETGGAQRGYFHPFVHLLIHSFTDADWLHTVSLNET